MFHDLLLAVIFCCVLWPIVVGKREHDKKSSGLIILVGLPKSGTTAVHDAFLDRGIYSVHHHVEEHIHLLCPPDEFPIDGVWVGSNTTRKYWHPVPAPMHHCYVGTIVQRALLNGLPPLEYMTEKSVKAFCQLDVCYPPSVCVFPQFEAIEEITTAYPDAHYIHTRRITVDVHVGSLTAWKPQVNEDSLIDRLRETGYLSMFPSQSIYQSEVENLKHFVREVSLKTISFFEKRPHLNFLDVAIEDPHAGEKIGAFLGMSNFSLVKANTGHYHDGITASPTPANFSAYLGVGGDDGEDDDHGATRPPSSAAQHAALPSPSSAARSKPSRTAPASPPTDDDAPVSANKAASSRSGSSSSGGGGGRGGGGGETKNTVGAATAVASGRTQTAIPLDWLPGSPTLYLDMTSFYMGAVAALLLACLCALLYDSCSTGPRGLCSILRPWSARVVRGVVHGGGKAVYSPVPQRDSGGVRGGANGAAADDDDDDEEEIGCLDNDADIDGGESPRDVELTMRQRRGGPGVQHENDEFGLGEEA